MCVCVCAWVVCISSSFGMFVPEVSVGSKSSVSWRVVFGGAIGF